MNRTPPSTASLRPAPGYAGTSHKNCKGIFKGLINRCLIEQRRSDGETTIMSGEDLCNVGPVALLQDLAVCAALGIESVERNAIIITPACHNCPWPRRPPPWSITRSLSYRT